MSFDIVFFDRLSTIWIDIDEPAFAIHNHGSDCRFIIKFLNEGIYTMAMIELVDLNYKLDYCRKIIHSTSFQLGL